MCADRLQEQLWTLQDVTNYLGLGADHRDPVSAVRYLCRTRKLKHVKVGKTLRFKKAWVNEYLEKEAVQPINADHNAAWRHP